jgi:hypothetical protein
MGLTELNYQQGEIEPVRLIDEVSSTEYYIGESINGNNQSNPTWKIKRIWKVSTIYHFGFPDGQQEYKFIWDDRYDCNYYI